jgi:hypothetical protein
MFSNPGGPNIQPQCELLTANKFIAQWKNPIILAICSLQR